ncbi:uncharacterized protein F4822DRAFT_400974 [Hypoxylon trugodes]|uniref:uncharacterized protein n=1 Tax=Hypoxylon trugodes TaxID=326681 RepID=UPI00219AD7FD|nr:uncharacterized protein F4822DRAFT_400974 [Hypoxylon trugodes]KAI1390136.1 hypothetical protein F4822DRAFT_400974 [Hypoxylon trugodes]
MKFIRELVREAKLLNFYIYGQWFLLAGLIVTTIYLVIVVPIEFTHGTLLPHAHWPESAILYTGWASGVTIVGIILLLFIPNERLKNRHDELISLTAWLTLSMLHWVGFGIGLPYLASALLLSIGSICYGVAYLLCQNPRKTRLTGGTAVAGMLLAIPDEKNRGGSSWTGLSVMAGCFFLFALITFGVRALMHWAFYKGTDHFWDISW